MNYNLVPKIHILMLSGIIAGSGGGVVLEERLAITSAGCDSESMLTSGPAASTSIGAFSRANDTDAELSAAL